MLKSYLKVAWRAISNNKGLSALNIAGLAVGMTTAVLIFFWVTNELSYDCFHKDGDRIYRINTRTTDGNWVWEGAPGLFGALAHKDVPGIEQFARLYSENWPTLSVHGDMQYEKKCAYVDYNWFHLFDYRFLQGNAEGFQGNPHSVILTESAVKKYFGDQEAIGASLKIDSNTFQVQGVIADPPTNSSFQYDMYIPIGALMSNPSMKESEASWGNTDYLTFIAVQKGINLIHLNNQLTTAYQSAEHDDAHTLATSLVGLPAMHFENDLQGSKFEHGSMSVVYIFSILGLLLLLVASINYVNLATAKASLRAKEVSIRKIVGAGRRHLFYQFLTESFLICLVALVLTLGLIYLVLPLFDEITGKHFTLDLTALNLWAVLGSTLVASFLLNSIYPALLLSSFKPLNIFRGITVLKVKDAQFRKGLVVVQFCISLILLTGTIVIYRQMHFIQNSNPGYNRSQVLVVGLPRSIAPGNKQGLIQTIKQELLQQSGIQSVSLTNQSIVRVGSSTTGIDWEGHDSSKQIKVNQISTDADLLSTMGLQLAQGRWFDPANATDSRNVVLNETAIKELGIHTPVLGQSFSIHGKKGQIIGVLKDFKYKSMHDKTGPLVIFNDPNWWNFFLIKTTAQGASGVVQTVKEVWNKTLPGQPMEYSFMDEQFNKLYAQEQLVSMLVLTFSIIAVIISAMGLFGLAAFEAEQRTKELGIRKILGASLMDIGLLLSTGFLRLIGLAILISFPLAWWTMTKWLDNFAYRINMQWWMLGLSGGMILLVTLGITGYHTLKASVVNPVKSLRPE